MTEFPRTMIEGLSVSRLMIGINWFLGYSHTSRAKDKAIVETMTADRIADIVGAVDVECALDAVVFRPAPARTGLCRDHRARPGRARHAHEAGSMPTS
jgi:hypothetical protein